MQTIIRILGINSFNVDIIEGTLQVTMVVKATSSGASTGLVATTTSRATATGTITTMVVTGVPAAGSRSVVETVATALGPAAAQEEVSHTLHMFKFLSKPFEKY